MFHYTTCHIHHLDMDRETTVQTIKQQSQTHKPGILREDKYEHFQGLIGQTVINLSDRELTKAEFSILGKGLTFCPTPLRPDYSEIWSDFKEFHRRLELKKFFEGLEDNDPSPIDLKFKNKSTWRPPVSNKTLEAFYRAVKNDLIKYSKKPVKRPKTKHN